MLLDLNPVIAKNVDKFTHAKIKVSGPARDVETSPTARSRIFRSILMSKSDSYTTDRFIKNLFYNSKLLFNPSPCSMWKVK